MSDVIKTIRCCESSHCYKQQVHSFEIASGKFIFLCKNHYIEEVKKKFGEYYEITDDSK